MPSSIGAMRERLVILDPTARPIRVTSLTRSGTTATAVTAKAHNLANGDYVTMAGAALAGYNGRVKVTVVNATTFTYTVASGLATPATGTITVTYLNDAQGGHARATQTLTSIFAELVNGRAREQLLVQGIGEQSDLMFRTWVRSDLTAAMKVQWTPMYPPDAAQRTLEIHGVAPDEDGRQFMFLACGDTR